MSVYCICNRCVMDTSASDIEFDEQGNCNFCSDFLKLLASQPLTNVGERNNRFTKLISDVKKAGKRKRYDCIVGVSGGIDSAYTLVKVIESGLRPLAVHMDNNWNSELATNNISNLIEKLGVDLYTHVVDWEEYRALMQSFFNENVIDVEILYDNAMLAINYQLAAKHGIRYILAGTNTATEGMRFPKEWNWFKWDKSNIKAIAAKNGVKLRHFPAVGSANMAVFKLLKRIQWVSFLDHIEYNKNDAIARLQSEFGFKPYPYKHYESVFTRFYQGYILPQKFGVDKRRIHLSTLIISGQTSRAEALNLLVASPYPDTNQLKIDKEFFLKKMDWPEAQLENYILRPPTSHENFNSEIHLWRRLSSIKKHLKNTGLNRFMKIS